MKTANGSLFTLTLLLHLLLLLGESQQQQKKWIPYSANELPESIQSLRISASPLLPFFKSIQYPLHFFSRLPVQGDYLLFLPFIDSPHFDYCTFSQKIHDKYSIHSCTDFFCNNQTAGVLLTNNRTDYAAIFNYCLYCSVRNASDPVQLQESIAFQHAVLKNLSSCPYAFQHFATSHCGEQGYTMLSNETIAMKDFNKNKPFVCYCTDSDKYGGYCDAYTSGLNDWNYYGKNWIFALFSLVFLVILVVMVMIPSFAFCLGKLNRARRHRQLAIPIIVDTLFDLRLQSVIFLAICFVLLLLEEVFAVLEVMSSTAEVVSAIGFTGGMLRIPALSGLGLSYAAMLVLWVSCYSLAQTLSRQRKLAWNAKLLLLALYFGLFLIVLLLIVLTVAKVEERYVYAVCTGFALLYCFFFPFGFTFYGVAMYCILKSIKSNNFGSSQNLKIARFVVFANVGYITAFVLYLLVVIGFLVGWDYMGYALGSYRNVFFDLPAFYIASTIIYMLYDSRSFIWTYRPLLSCICSKKCMNYIDPEVQLPPEDTRSMAIKKRERVAEILKQMDEQEALKNQQQFGDMSPTSSSPTALLSDTK